MAEDARHEEALALHRRAVEEANGAGEPPPAPDGAARAAAVRAFMDARDSVRLRSGRS
ncbi:MAG TPA: hypothetical protein VM840_03585 [Actinomycetota bacterium]|nr:hypothetical protein [Actinomycetota bacterium]